MSADLSSGIKAGDVLIGQSGKRFVVGEQIAVEGQPDCTSWRCRRIGSHQREDGSWEPGRCVGYHCPVCGEPCSMMGHAGCQEDREVEFTARIRLSAEDWENVHPDDLEQAVQNAIGHSGASVVSADWCSRGEH